jgi:5-methylcytosine-specific restriction endonuclease McrA
VKELQLSEGEAFRRLVAARLGRKFPIVHSLVASGSVHLSALTLLRPHLTQNNHTELLEAVRGKSKREVEALLATRFPARDEPAHMRAVSPERFRIEFTASTELREKLERCLDLSSHANPKRDLGFVIERATELLLAKLERERLGKAKCPRTLSTISGTPNAQTSKETPSIDPASRRITTAARRSVFERDGNRCTYVSPDGNRCNATAFLELDHIIPHARGGRTAPENLRIRCRAHNRLWAEQVFGRDHIDRALHFRQRKYRVTKADAHAGNETPSASLTKGSADSSLSAHEKVALALEKMGFQRSQARKALRAVERRQCGEKTRTLEALLREAVLEATRAA